MKLITLQPSPRVDGLNENGTERTQLPYPIHATEDGTVLRQDFWQGNPASVVGVVADLHRQEIDHTWEEVWADPQLAVGKYVVTADTAGRFGTWQIAIETAREVES